MMTTAGFIVRMLLTLLTVFGTYNPSGYSYWHWIRMEDAGDWTLKLFAGTVIVFLLYTHVLATWRSMKLIGVTMVVISYVTAVWTLWDHDLLDLNDPTIVTLTLLSGVTLVLGMGFLWSLVRYRLSGQVDSQNVIPP
ncbi:DUF6524 family protein [Azospirillum sp. TSO22-1]|uniref:DUF6524 family protein n=1 Tax=Azospirillum sp. TSO22-1 TaxID=716789 RepID=UPI000D6463A0|nr:DUF6524 family protein [Azospirillum sp. TSO22-1]